MRIYYSFVLISLAVIIAFLPERKNSRREKKPSEVFAALKNDSWIISADQLAKMIIDEETDLQLIDLRDPEEYRYCNIPGSINIPVLELFAQEKYTILQNSSFKTVVYSNDGIEAAQVRVLMLRAGIPEVYVLQGGLNEWFNTILHSEYSGSTISAKENAVFETRYRARNYFTQMNSLPDSMKLKFLRVKKAEEKKLVGGCE